MEKEYAIAVRAILEQSKIDTSELSDKQVVSLYHREQARRYHAIAIAAQAASKSIRQVAGSLKKFHRATLKSACASQSFVSRSS